MNSGEDRQFEETEETLAMLREAHRQPIPEAHFTAVRAHVLAEIAAGHHLPMWRRLGWKWAACGLVAAAALAMFTIRPTRLAQPLRPQAPAALQAAARREPALPGVLAQRTTRPAHRRHIALVAGAYSAIGPRAIGLVAMRPLPDPQPLVVKLITDDPNVVIYWISEPKGGY
jgi:hypothetical protein